MKKTFLFVLLSSLLLACSKDSSNNTTTNNTIAVFELSSTAFNNNATIPDKYSCKVSNQVFMPLNWKNAPEGTLSFVLLMEDSDAIAVAGSVWDHWILYNIPAGTNAIQEGTSRTAPLPGNTITGKSSFMTNNYGGPCPPNGQTHTYTFSLLALDVTDIGLTANDATKAAVYTAINGHVLGKALYRGKFTQ